jgi:thymidylate synthase (FAD)
MKLIYEPTVYLLGRPNMVDSGLSEFLRDHEVADWDTDTDRDGEALPEVAGRLCYMSFARPRPGGNEAYLKHILEVGHGSVLEHAVWNFIFTGISRSLTHELVRHRAGVGISQFSQRYCDESEAAFVVPPELQREVWAGDRFRKEEPDGANFQTVLAYYESMTDETRAGLDWLTGVCDEQDRYVRLVEYLIKRITDERYADYVQSKKDQGLAHYTGDYDWWWQNDGKHQATEIRKAARGAARSVLPNATETKIFVSANARALRHMIEMRCSRHADAEIRVLFGRVLDIMQKEAPNLFSDYRRVELPDGTFEAVTEHRKV